MKFAVVSGEISNLHIFKGHENMLFSATQSQLAGIGAIAAAAAGAGTASSVMARAHRDAEMPMDFFTCTINEKAVTGCFFKVGFQDGQYIDFVVHDQMHTSEVYAARDPKRRLVWTKPYRSKGHLAQKRSNICGGVLFVLSIAILSFGLVIYAEDMKISSLETAAKVTCTMSLFAIFLSWKMCRKFFGHGQEVTEVLNCLGFLSPAHVNLPKKRWNAEKNYASEIGQKPVRFENNGFRYDASALELNGDG
jgi:hypothetical protein